MLFSVLLRPSLRHPDPLDPFLMAGAADVDASTPGEEVVVDAPVRPSRRLTRPGPPRRPSLRRRLLVLTVSIVIGVGLAEGISRLARGAPGGGPGHHRLFCEFDATLGWRKVPGHRGRHTTGEYDVVETFNSRGLRGPEHAYQKPAGTRRVLVLGDSFVEGYTVGDAENVCRVLESELRAGRSGDVEVINGGTGGYSTDQELLFFASEGRRYAPDLTVLMFYENDVFWNAQEQYGPHGRGRKPRFALTPKGLVPVNLPLERPAEATEGAGGVRGLKQWLAANSSLYGVARDVVWGLRGRAGKAGLPMEFHVWAVEESGVIDHAWRLTKALIDDLRAKARAAGSELVVFYVPPRPLVEPALWDEIRGRFGLDADAWSPRRSLDRLRTLCDELRVPLIDPVAAFQAEARKHRLYFPIDGHWNARGHVLAARSVARWLAIRRW